MADREEIIKSATSALQDIQYGILIAGKLLPDLVEIKNSYNKDSEEYEYVEQLIDELEYYV